MIFVIDKNKIDFIQVDLEEDTTAFIVSCLVENDVDDLYQHFKGFRMSSYRFDGSVLIHSSDALWYYKKTYKKNISETEKFYSDRYKHWSHFAFEIPDNIMNEELELYFKLKYCS